MARISDSYCLNHPDTPAAARCAACGKPVCARCVVTQNGVDYCSEACARAAADSAGRVDSAVEAGRRNASKARARQAVTLIVIVVIALVGWFLFKKYRKEVDSFARKTSKQVQSGLDSSRNSIQKSVPGDSKYKRDREGSLEK